MEPLPKLFSQQRVLAHGRLVQDQHLGLGDQRAGQRSPAVSAARQGADKLVGSVGKAHLLESLVGVILGYAGIK